MSISTATAAIEFHIMCIKSTDVSDAIFPFFHFFKVEPFSSWLQEAACCLWKRTGCGVSIPVQLLLAYVTGTLSLIYTIIGMVISALPISQDYLEDQRK